ncbi:hypothetical protein ACC685_37355 [Rhizobium ruizarguesonis]
MLYPERRVMAICGDGSTAPIVARALSSSSVFAIRVR